MRITDDELHRRSTCWGNAWGYAGGATYTLTSLGSDGAVGPVPPTPWISDPASANLILTDGQFIQAPTAQ